MNIQSYNPSFQANINSRKLKFKRKDFYVPISGYGKNKTWADEVKSTADRAVDLIRKNAVAESVLLLIATGVKKANDFTNDIFKINNTAVLRQPRTHWCCATDWDELILTTNYSEITRYTTYQRKFFYNRSFLCNTLPSPKKNLLLLDKILCLKIYTLPSLIR